MTHRHEIGGAKASTERRAPLDTNFTTATPDVPTWQQSMSTPAADELGLIRRMKPVPRNGWRKVLHGLTGGSFQKIVKNRDKQETFAVGSEGKAEVAEVGADNVLDLWQLRSVMQPDQ